jgi:heme A synthase
VLGFWVVALRERRSQPGAYQLVSLLLLLFIAQGLLGAATQWTTLADWSRVVHLTVGALTWVTVVLVVGLLVYGAAWFPSMTRRMALPAFFPDRLSVRESQPGD